MPGTGMLVSVCVCHSRLLSVEDDSWFGLKAPRPPCSCNWLLRKHDLCPLVMTSVLSSCLYSVFLWTGSPSDTVSKSLIVLEWLFICHRQPSPCPHFHLKWPSLSRRFYLQRDTTRARREQGGSVTDGRCVVVAAVVSGVGDERAGCAHVAGRGTCQRSVAPGCPAQVGQSHRERQACQVKLPLELF